MTSCTCPKPGPHHVDYNRGALECWAERDRQGDAHSQGYRSDISGTHCACPCHLKRYGRPIEAVFSDDPGEACDEIVAQQDKPKPFAKPHLRKKKGTWTPMTSAEVALRWVERSLLFLAAANAAGAGVKLSAGDPHWSHWALSCGVVAVASMVVGMVWDGMRTRRRVFKLECDVVELLMWMENRIAERAELGDLAAATRAHIERVGQDTQAAYNTALANLEKTKQKGSDDATD